MGEMMSMRKAGDEAGVNRQTISKWVAEGRLARTEKRMVGAILATFVDLAEVKREAAKIRAGRPRKDGKRPGSKA